ncbi:hypothetical protein SAMN05421848_0204 [Kushneria avicenniae]|uniref:Uncharacterized protein n=1 Tax=Kushneria avicenniae TaxID=402385 RepID=A0A1I1FT48_9GAMM|nr:hypothetical protein [Kushneria avicenniae]SFC00818.1 hypothetical protein SAMN05421848_0204 [Kushneria avicenniae]
MARQLKSATLWLGITVAIGALSGCSLFSSDKPQGAAAVPPPPTLVGYNGMNVCQPYSDKLWGNFLMIGKVVSVDSPDNMHVNVLRAEAMKQPSIQMTGYPREIIDQRNKWYPCEGQG